MLKALWAMIWFYNVPVYMVAIVVTFVMVLWFFILATN